MPRLIICQVSGTNPPQFIVRNRETDQSAPACVVPSPFEWPVRNAGTDPLMVQLGWLLETFTQYRADSHVTQKAAYIQEAIEDWGTAACDQLFNSNDARNWLPRQTNDTLDIVISCDSPEYLAWPWEALHDPTLRYFGLRARIQRRLSHAVPEPPALPALPTDQIRILLVTARPFKRDVDYRSISRPLVDLIRSDHLPASVHVLRPPTIENLRHHLFQERPGHYHILHFDGHGGYGEHTRTSDRDHFGGHEGRLHFEDGNGGVDEITASKLAEQLQGCTVPFVVLNACRSAKLDARAFKGRAFASVAGSLVHCGFRGVLAMAYNLSVTGAHEFLPAFYRELFLNGNLLDAARAGRLQMSLRNKRSTSNPDAKLPDWILPVVYQQREDFDLSFVRQAVAPEEAVKLPAEATVAETPTFVGRDGAIQAIERALRQPAAAVLVHGLGGVGKTSLARHFLHWLRDTGGLTHPPFWFAFDDLRTATSVFNQMGREFKLYGSEFDADRAQHYAALVLKLRQQPHLLVWDNFESACGFQLERVYGRLSQPDQLRLRDFLQDLGGGRTKVLITSRSEEGWLSAEICRRVQLQGLRAEELWEYIAQVSETLGLKINPRDRELHNLFAVKFDGHPVLIRAAMAQLEHQPPARLAQQLNDRIITLVRQGHQIEHARLLASLDLIGAAFKPEEKSYLLPLALHERYTDLDFLVDMTHQTNHLPKPDTARLERVLHRLERSGLVSHVRGNVYSLHPLLTSYLCMQVLPAAPADERESWVRAFVMVMTSLADALAPKELHEERDRFGFHHANFHRALELATVHGMQVAIAALTQALAVYALNCRNFSEAATLFQSLAEHQHTVNNERGEAGACHQLGLIAQKRRDFATAERWYLKALAVWERLGDEHHAATTYHQVGSLAQEQRDFAAAERWYLKALAITEKPGNELGAANTYHQLGLIAQEQRDFAAAKDWYLKSLAIEEKQGNEHGEAMTSNQLGIIAQLQRDFTAAERWFLRSLAIKEKQGNEHGAASTYHQLGSMAQEQRDFATAEHWCRKSLAVWERLGNGYNAANTCHQLGIIAQLQRDFTAAERWFLRSLAIKDKQGNEHGAASTYHQLGINAQEQQDFTAAERWYLKALAIWEKHGNEHGAASTYHQLGRLTEERGDTMKAGELFLRAFVTLHAQHDPHNARIALGGFARLLRAAPPAQREQLRHLGCNTLGEAQMQVTERASAQAK